MSLTTALNIAQTALFNTSQRTSVVSRNVSEASNPDYSRRSAVLSSLTPGARIAEIQRAANDVLFRRNLQAISGQSGQSAITSGLDMLQMGVNGVDNASSPANALANLKNALQLYTSAPSNGTLAESTVDAARQVVRALNQGTSAIQKSRADADSEIAAAVSNLNTLLANFEKVNAEVVSGTRMGRDTSDALDQRDALLKRISDLVPVSASTRDGNDMVLTTTDGTTLFDTVARSVTFQPKIAYAAGVSGNAVFIDGVPMRPGSGGNTNASGFIAAKLQLRDDIAIDMQRQLDEVARGVITAFSEADPSGISPDATGLFTWSGSPAVPPSGTLIDGIAASISINATVDASQGGDPSRLRDGVSYMFNTTGAASFSNHLLTYAAQFDEPIVFDAASGVNGTKSVSDYASASVGWLGAMRQDAAHGSETKQALATRTATALSNATGVNMDEEMSLLLDLEHSYQASARLISTVDSMLAALLQATG